MFVDVFGLFVRMFTVVYFLYLFVIICFFTGTLLCICNTPTWGWKRGTCRHTEGEGDKPCIGTTLTVCRCQWRLSDVTECKKTIGRGWAPPGTQLAIAYSGASNPFVVWEEIGRASPTPSLVLSTLRDSRFNLWPRLSWVPFDASPHSSGWRRPCVMCNWLCRPIFRYLCIIQSRLSLTFASFLERKPGKQKVIAWHLHVFNV